MKTKIEITLAESDAFLAKLLDEFPLRFSPMYTAVQQFLSQKFQGEDEEAIALVSNVEAIQPVSNGVVHRQPGKKPHAVNHI